MEIQYFNRYTNQNEIEKVYGDAAVKWMYQTFLGKTLGHVIAKKFVSKIYGATQDFSSSKNKIKPFVEKFNIQMDDFLPEEGRTPEDPYSSFNAFFIRRFKEGKRSFAQGNQMAAFSEARYFGYESIQDDETIPVKGRYLNSKELLANEKWTETFQDGPLLLARLCPVDYHRFHYPDAGKVIDHYPVRGKLHSVNPIALKEFSDIFSTNERYVSILETEHFGKLAYVEVGATCVGKIVQSTDLKDFNRGDEKGYFLFGGSTVIVIGEKGKWKPSSDILKNTKEARETYIHLGDSVAEAL